MSFAELPIWTFIMIFAVLLLSMLVASILKHFIPALQKTLIPVSVLGGILLLVISTVVYFTAGDYLFNLPAFGSPSADDSANAAMSGMEVLEVITYHCLGIGFIASGMRNSKKKFTKKRAGEIFDLNRKVMIVADSGLPDSLTETVAGFCGEPHIFKVSGGERSKSLAVFEDISTRMLQSGFDRGVRKNHWGGRLLPGRHGFCELRGAGVWGENQPKGD